MTTITTITITNYDDNNNNNNNNQQNKHCAVHLWNLCQTNVVRQPHDFDNTFASISFRQQNDSSTFQTNHKQQQNNNQQPFLIVVMIVNTTIIAPCVPIWAALIHHVFAKASQLSMDEGHCLDIPRQEPTTNKQTNKQTQTNKWTDHHHHHQHHHQQQQEQQPFYKRVMPSS